MSLLTDLIAVRSNPPDPFGTDKDTTHCYGPVYTELFAPIRDTVRSVLEIGVFSGAFTEVLVNYFPHAEVHAVDITLQDVRYAKDILYRTVRFYEADGTDPALPAKIGKTFDVIIEDASHKPDDQVATLAHFAPYLNAGGIYVIEDIPGENLPALAPRLEAVAAANGLTMEVRDLRSVKHRFDDVLAIFTKP